MNPIPTPFILMADDDADDRLLMEALEESKLSHTLHFVEDGLELLDYLHKRGKFGSSLRPNLILLDLNMPKMDGRQALEHIKTNTNLKSIPLQRRFIAMSPGTCIQDASKDLRDI
jgi:two-component system response regulator